MPPKTPAPARALKTSPRTFVARIHPWNPQRGYRAQTYVMSGSGYPAFKVERGWYTVDAAMAAKLREILNNPSDPHSRPVFQVCEADEANALDEAETVKAAEARSPVPLPRPASTPVPIPAARKPAAVVAKAPTPVATPEPVEMDEDQARAARRRAAAHGKVLETADEEETAEIDDLVSGALGGEDPEDGDEVLTAEEPESPDLTSAEVGEPEPTPVKRPRATAPRSAPKATKKVAKTAKRTG